MSILNTKQRRLSMAVFVGLFLLSVFLCSFAFMKSVKMGEKLPTDRLKELEKKEKILADFAELSDALYEYNKAMYSSPELRNKHHARCERLSTVVHDSIATKDTTRIYEDVNKFVKMADQYMQVIDEIGDDTNEQIEKLKKEFERVEDNYKERILLLEEAKEKLKKDRDYQRGLVESKDRYINNYLRRR